MLLRIETLGIRGEFANDVLEGMRKLIYLFTGLISVSRTSRSLDGGGCSQMMPTVSGRLVFLKDHYRYARNDTTTSASE